VAEEVEPPEPPSPVAEAPPAVPPTPLKPDDLKVIEGIGPKISGLLHAAGVRTFAQLANTDVERLRQILVDANLTRLADPGTWPEQAALAAAGDWDGLKALQDSLKGGRRV
jgi:predicted flap endonuclease-1-like 5' DNA nuclease